MKFFSLKIIFSSRFLMVLYFLVISGMPDARSQEFVLEVDSTLERLVSVADSDKDRKITIEDELRSPFWIRNQKGDTIQISETYYLSNLLQELALAQQNEQRIIELSLEHLKEPPADRISRRIRMDFWDDLTRTIDREGIMRILQDSKAQDTVQRLYVPASDSAGISYYKGLQREFEDFEVVVLPLKITPQYVRSINNKPGLLALKLENGRGVPFVVPGGRFNEMYGWDSYFEAVGLLIDGRLDLAKAMVDNFVYQINHYGKILNANRSYYLTRTQPPLMSSFVREVYQAMEKKDKAWLKEALSAAIQEYEQVWMVSGERLSPTGLNRYFGQGIGIPPETEEGHFDQVLKSFAARHGMAVSEFEMKYKSGEIVDQQLDAYFTHDRSLRESGHDTSWRLENRAANLNTVDLNSLLFKYEKDFEFLITTYFDDQFTSTSGTVYTSAYWEDKAAQRKQLINRYLWNETKGSFFDYDFIKAQQTGYVSATNLYPLWAGLATREQGRRMVQGLKKHLTAPGGILSTAKISVATTATNPLQRQWDYPNGWAPHQMLLWRGLLDYGYKAEAYQLIYRWLYMITRNAADYNGTIPEKYDVVNRTHKVYAEYGNVGTEFDYITTSGFGWMNASYQLGLDLLPEKYREHLNRLSLPEHLDF